MTRNIDILMATYNGEAFIEEQIDSLIKQTLNSWNLIIHDDGSTDGTLDIIKKYSLLDSRIKLVNDGIRGLGACKNFLHLLRFSTASFIIFCDQDDIWMPDKLKVLYSEIDSESGPAAVYCDAFAYFSKESKMYKVTFYQRSNLKDTLFLNGGIHGCNIMFNKELLKILNPLPDYVYMHDHLITLGVITFGKLKYINEPLMYYRQHEKNVTGRTETNFVRRLLRFIDNRYVIDYDHFHAVESFYECYKSSIVPNKQKDFSAYFKYANTPSVFKRLNIILENNFKVGSRFTLFVKTIIRKPINRNKT